MYNVALFFSFIHIVTGLLITTIQKLYALPYIYAPKEDNLCLIFCKLLIH
jgi:hypothetical protein